MELDIDSSERELKTFSRLIRRCFKANYANRENSEINRDFSD